MKLFRLLSRIALGLLLTGCAAPTLPKQKPQALTMPAAWHPASAGATIASSTQDDVQGIVLIAQSLQSDWWEQYDDPFGCVLWTRDTNGDDLLRFENTYCSGSSAPDDHAMAFTLTLSDDPDGVSGHLALLGNDGKQLGAAYWDLTQSNIFITDLCTGDYSSRCQVKFSAQGSFQSLSGPQGQNLSF